MPLRIMAYTRLNWRSKGRPSALRRRKSEPMAAPFSVVRAAAGIEHCVRTLCRRPHQSAPSPCPSSICSELIGYLPRFDATEYAGLIEQYLH